MPQLLPFYFLQSFISFFVLFALILWVMSVIILPNFPRLQITRLFIANL